MTLVFGRFLKADVTICKLLTDPNRNCTDEQVRADWTQYLLSWDNNNLHLLFFSSHPSKRTCQYLLTEATDPNRNCADMWGTASPIDVGWDAARKRGWIVSCNFMWGESEIRWDKASINYLNKLLIHIKNYSNLSYSHILSSYPTENVRLTTLE